MINNQVCFIGSSEKTNSQVYNLFQLQLLFYVNIVSIFSYKHKEKNFNTNPKQISKNSCDKF